MVDTQDFREIIGNVVYPGRQRALMMCIRNEEQGVVRSPEYIECPKTAHPQVIPVEWDDPKTKNKVTQRWTRIFTRGEWATAVMFPGSLNDWTYAVNPYEVSDIYKRYMDAAKWITLIGYTIMWFTISVQAGQVDISWQALWGSGWFPLGMGLMIGGLGWMKHMNNSTDMDQIDLTVQSTNKDQHGNIVYICKPSHLKTNEELKQWGLDQPEEWFDKFLTHLDEIQKFGGEEYKAIIDEKIELKNDNLNLKNQLSGKESTWRSQRESINRQDNLFNLMKGLITAGMICFIVWVLVTAWTGGSG